MMDGFVIPAATPGSPDTVDRRRKMAELMMAQAGRAEPISHWSQGLNKMAQALIGGLSMRRADQQEAEGRKNANERLAWALSGGKGVSQGDDPNGSLVQAMNDPWMSPQGQQMLYQQWQQQNQPPAQPKFENVGGRLVRIDPNGTVSEAYAPPAAPDFEIIQDKSTGEIIRIDRNDPRAKPEVIREGGMQPMDAPKVQTITQPDGSQVAVQWDQTTGKWVPLEAPQGGNPVKTLPKLTEQQSKDLVYYQRGEAALGNLDKNETALTGVWDSTVDNIPGVGNMMTSTDYQTANQAGREFLAAILRKDTGAAITNQEMAIYGKMYLPQPGDSPEVLAQKKTARRTALDAIRTGLGAASRALPEPSAPEQPPAAPQDGWTTLPNGVRIRRKE